MTDEREDGFGIRLVQPQDDYVEQKRSERGAYLDGLNRRYKGDIEFVGGGVSVYAFDEVWGTYYEGCFIGCVLLVQLVLEHTLCGLFLHKEGRKDVVEWGFATLIAEARESGHITEKEQDAFNTVRRLRNKYTHKSDIDSIPAHWFDEAYDRIEDVMEADARSAIETMHGLLNREPFNLTKEYLRTGVRPGPKARTKLRPQE